MHYPFRANCKTILLDRAIKLSKITNISTTIVQLEATYIGTTLSLLSYARAFGENYVVDFVKEHMLDNVEDIISSNFGLQRK